MSKQVIVIVGLVFASSAFGQVPGEILSFHCEGVNPEEPCIFQIPAGGFIVSDITAPDDVTVELLENGVLKVVEQLSHVINGTFGSAFDLHRSYRSGIPFTGSSTMQVGDPHVSSSACITISGYIPCLIPCQANLVPVVGSLGQAIIVLSMVVAATLVLRRRESVGGVACAGVNR